jgi:hypothetical protein
MRVYLPATTAILADLARTGELGPAPLRGYAVTGAVREAYDESDEEELEYWATCLAAEDSLRLLAAGAADSSSSPTAAPLALRRVVIAAELADGLLTAAAEPLGAVTLADCVPLARVAAFHLDDPGFTVDPGDPEGAADQELLWYAAQELGDLLRP